MATTRPSTMRRMYNAFVDARFRSVEREIARMNATAAMRCVERRRRRRRPA